MLGTQAHGKTRVYRYYSCHRRTRYDSAACGGQRIDADAIEQAVTGALAGFYRHQHALIADSIAAAQASHAAAAESARGELAATDRQLTRTGAAIDRYLAAFEDGAPQSLLRSLPVLRTRRPRSTRSGVTTN
jgi:site-specific DNA recombinase